MIKICYIISILLLLLSFLLLKKYNKRVNIVRELIYTISLFICYNVFIVYLVSMLGIRANIFLYSLINLIIAMFLLIITIKKKDRQMYRFDGKEAISICLFGIVLLLIGFYKTDGLNKINYMISSDSAVHYESAYIFSKELNLFNGNNCQDIIFGSFDRMMPISYINGGFFINVFNCLKPYKAFMLYDLLCYTLCSLLFLVTIIEIFKIEKKKLYLGLLGFLYCLAFSLNSFLFGFCYLGLGVMVINLLVLTIYKFRDSFERSIFYKILILFLIVFSVFFSYYLFVPSIYLSLGIYYILLCKSKKISIKQMFLYGIITLIVPFVIGVIYFVIPFFDRGDTFLSAVSLYGGCYRNVTPIYFYGVFTVYFVYRIYSKKEKLNYLTLSLGIHTLYILMFIGLFAFNLCDIYYFYKLFFVYWVFAIIYIGCLFLKHRKYLYIASIFVFGLIIFTVLFRDTRYANYLVNSNIYSYNAYWINYEGLFDKEELELAEASIKYKDMCGYNDTFLMVGSNLKNYWYYAVTGNIPVIFDASKDVREQMAINDNTLLYFDYLPEYKCVVYYNEGHDDLVSDSKYDILYENGSGAILKRTDYNQEWLEGLFD